MQTCDRATRARVKKNYCLGIDAIKEYGIRKWKEEFFMPFSAEDYDRIRDTMTSAVKSTLLSDIRPECKDLMRILIKAIYGYAHSLHRYIFASYLKTYGYDAVGSEVSRYRDLMGRMPAKGIKTRLKHNVLNLKENFKRPRMDKKALNVGGSLKAKDLYAKKYRLSLLFASPGQFMAKRGVSSEPFLNGIGYILDTVDAAAREVLDYYGLKYKLEYDNSREDLLAGLKENTECAFLAALEIYLDVRTNIKNLDFDCILANNLGNIFNRILTQCAKTQGKKIIGFNHGNTVGLYHDIGYVLSETMLLNTYVVSPGGSRPFFEETTKKYSDFIHRDKTFIEPADDGYLFRVWQAHKDRPVEKRAKRVMIVEPAFSPYMTLYRGALYYSTQLDLTLRIIETLKKHGYYCILKSRPEYLKETEKGRIYRGLADKCLSGWFEDAYDAADTIIFTHMHTTTFGFSLATNKRIIYFLYEKEKYIQQKLDILNKRCAPVNCRFDERNRIAFDEACLTEALEKENTGIDTEFLERYMFL